MGCDIHMVVEVKYEGEWVGIHACPYFLGEVYGGVDRNGEPLTGTDAGVVSGSVHWRVRARNYELFAALAGVRGEREGGVIPKGIPNDVSALARAEIAGWGDDGHSHSWHLGEEFVALASKHRSIPDVVRQTVETGREHTIAQLMSDYLGVSDAACEEPENIRVVYWFDN